MNTYEARSFNIGTRFGRVLGFDWLGEFRTDRNSDGTIEYGADTRVFGRWGLSGRSQYDLERDETLNYQLNMVRTDHDWRILLGLTFDTIDGDTSLTVNFVPTAGGLFPSRSRNFVSGSTLDDPTYNY